MIPRSASGPQTILSAITLVPGAARRAVLHLVSDWSPSVVSLIQQAASYSKRFLHIFRGSVGTAGAFQALRTLQSEYSSALCFGGQGPSEAQQAPGCMHTACCFVY